VTLNINDIQPKRHSALQKCHYAECLYAHCLCVECLYAHCLCVECLYAECHDFLIVILKVILLSVVMLNVVPPENGGYYISKLGYCDTQHKCHSA
jgi:hypothetical protein